MYRITTYGNKVKQAAKFWLHRGSYKNLLLIGMFNVIFGDIPSLHRGHLLARWTEWEADGQRLVLACPRLDVTRPQHAVDDSAQREYASSNEEHHLPRLAALLENKHEENTIYKGPVFTQTSGIQTTEVYTLAIIPARLFLERPISPLLKRPMHKKERKEYFVISAPTRIPSLIFLGEEGGGNRLSLIDARSIIRPTKTTKSVVDQKENVTTFREYVIMPNFLYPTLLGASISQP